MTGAWRMGKALSDEEQAALKVLQHFLSRTEIKYDKVLKKLLKWGWRKGFLPTLKAYLIPLSGKALALCSGMLSAMG